MEENCEVRKRIIDKSREKSCKEDRIREAYNKRLNFLIHDLAENPIRLWEIRDETLKIFNSFLVDGLKITHTLPNSSHLIHRLLQHPGYKSGTKHTRPIIIKLNSVFDKKKIFSSIKNLQNYNATLPLFKQMFQSSPDESTSLNIFLRRLLINVIDSTSV